jgi:hypothetical protein
MLTIGLENPKGIAVDVDGAKVYWGQWTPDVIQRANFDGTDVETVVSYSRSGTHALALDLRVPMDCDRDRTLTLPDHGLFALCMSGPGGEFGVGCSCADGDGDGDADLKDFATLQTGLVEF